MGIPSYFSYIIKNYSNIIRNLYMLRSDRVAFQHLYMDCNSIIYDVFRQLEMDHPELLADTQVLEDRIIRGTIDKISEYIELIRPSKTVFIAFDGVAPFAKMDQQRNRRYKGAVLAKMISTLNNTTTTSCRNSNTNPPHSGWSTSNITPGTQFMAKLSKRVAKTFQKMETHYKTERIIVSASDECGEGEHKMYQHMRNQTNGSNHKTDDTVAVYGLDSDLIMLSIFHCRLYQNIYIFRETPEFIKSSISVPEDPDRPFDQNDPKAPKPCSFMDIRQLSSAILTEMQCGVPDNQRIFDYVFLCFFLGNDFLPHFPSLNIRTTGIDTLMDTYRRLIGCKADRFFIARDMRIQWQWVSLFITELAKNEHDHILAEYDLRSKWSKRKWPVGTLEERDNTFNSVPVIYRAEEEYICPRERGWEGRYYKSLFRDHLMQTQTISSSQNIRGLSNNVCLNYLEGLEWVFKYYTMDCPHWRWKYQYHYPPLLVDLCKHIPNKPQDQDYAFIKSDALSATPFIPAVQLAYVLPTSNHGLLPTKVQELLKSKHGELFPVEFDFQWAFCRYFWETHVKLPEISKTTLERWTQLLK